MTDKLNPEIVAAWQRHTGNEHAKWPCQNFASGFNAGRQGTIYVAKPPTDGDTLTIDGRTFVFQEIDTDTAAQAAFDIEAEHAAKLAAMAQLQPLVMLKLTDAQAEELSKALGVPVLDQTVEAGLNVPVCQRCTLMHPATMGCEENLKPKDAPSTAGEIADGLPQKQIDPMTEAAIRGAIGGMVKQAMTEAGFISGKPGPGHHIHLYLFLIAGMVPDGNVPHYSFEKVCRTLAAANVGGAGFGI